MLLSTFVFLRKQKFREVLLWNPRVYQTHSLILPKAESIRIIFLLFDWTTANGQLGLPSLFSALLLFSRGFVVLYH